MRSCYYDSCRQGEGIVSEPKRYEIGVDFVAPVFVPVETEVGDWVKYVDYARLKAEVERLTADIKVYKEGVMKSDNLFQSIGIFVKDEEWVSDGITQLIERANKAEADVERLTDAGDRLCDKEFVETMGDYEFDSEAYAIRIRNWKKAKQSKP